MKFIEEVGLSGGDLPWAKDYAKTVGQVGDLNRVNHLYYSNSGFLLLGDLFKGFIFAGTQTHSFIKEAIPVWISSPNLPFSLYMQILKNGKVAVAVEEDEPCVFCVIEEGKYEFKKPNGEDLSERQALNPFITGCLPAPTTVKRPPKAKSPTVYPEIPL